ncbi:MAG: XTP/dITP diphosphatase [Deltaproteobacteria bacterium]|nr:MAG: XTP/dITP diphosphatase [Deltaproteobacteria bacterium]
MNPRTLLVATTNSGKLLEMSHYLQGIQLKSLKDFSQSSNIPTVEETGKTFLENALIKAHAYAAFSGLTTLADDSGLVVESLGGAPGIYSARYAGEDTNDADNRKKLLFEMKDIPQKKRQASFVCALALYDPDTQKSECFEGRVEGEILFEERGENGFGYDSLFFVPSLGKTTAQLSLEEKNRISHRGQALQKLKQYFNVNEF